MFIQNAFAIGQLVYLKTDKEQHPRMVTSIYVRPNDLLIYQLTQGVNCTDHFEIEISDSVDVLMTTTN